MGERESGDRTGPGPETPEALLLAATPTAWVTPVIAGLLVACFLGSIALGVHPLSPDAEQLFRAGGGFGPQLLEGEWWRLLTAGLLHGGLVHLAFNLWALWGAGQLAERIYGNAGFAGIYLLSAIGASLLSTAVAPLVVSIGASGAVFGVYGSLLAFAWLDRGQFPAAFLRQQRNSLLGFLGYNAFYAIVDRRTDVAGHAGGLLVGLAAGWLLRRDLRHPGAAARRRLVGFAAVALVLVAGAGAVRERVKRVPELKAMFLGRSAAELLAAGQLEPAVERYTEALAAGERWRLYYGRALALQGLGRLEEAYRDARIATERSPRSEFVARILLGELGLQLGRTDDAARECAALWTDHAWTDPEIQPAWLAYCASAARARKDADGAMGWANQLLGRAPDDTGLLRFRAVLLYEAGEWDAELVDLDRILHREPGHAGALNARAWVRVAGGDFAGGREDADRSLAAGPDRPAALGTRCFALVGLGDREPARRDCARAVELNPDGAVDRGMLAFLAGDLPASGRLWEEASRANAGDARALAPWIARARKR